MRASCLQLLGTQPRETSGAICRSGQTNAADGVGGTRQVHPNREGLDDCLLRCTWLVLAAGSMVTLEPLVRRSIVANYHLHYTFLTMRHFSHGGRAIPDTDRANIS